MSCNDLVVEGMLTAVMSVSCISPSAPSVYFLFWWFTEITLTFVVAKLSSTGALTTSFFVFISILLSYIYTPLVSYLLYMCSKHITKAVTVYCLGKISTSILGTNINYILLLLPECIAPQAHKTQLQAESPLGFPKGSTPTGKPELQEPQPCTLLCLLPHP